MEMLVPKSEITEIGSVYDHRGRVVKMAKVYHSDSARECILHKVTSLGPQKKVAAPGSTIYQVRHPNLVEYLGQTENHEGLFIVIEREGGKSLSYKLEEASENRGFYSESDIEYWLKEIACGLQYLHSVGIIDSAG